MSRNSKNKKDNQPDEKDVNTPETEQSAEQTDAVEPEIPEQPEPTAEELLASAHEKFLRLAAEYDNYRKRSQKERETLYAEIKAETVAKFLPAYDNLVRAHGDASGDEEKAPYFQVFDMLKRQLEGIFANLNVELLTSETEQGKPFDPERHNAILKMPATDENTAGTVAFVIQSGCAANGKVVKHADIGVFETES